MRLNYIVSYRVNQVVCAALLSVALSGAAAAGAARQAEPKQKSLNQLSLEELGNVEITTLSKQPGQVWKTPAAIEVISQEDIRRSGVTSIPEALRLAPGLEVARLDSGHWAVGVRGFSSQFSRSVLVMIDGRSVYTPLFAGVFWDVQDVLLEDVERIEVIRGPGGTIWGANAFSGVINIITKSARDTHGVLASLGGGSLDQAIGGFRFGGGDGIKFDYRVYGKVFTRGPQFHSDNLQSDDWRAGRAGFRLDGNTQRFGALTVQGDVYKGESGESVSVASYSPPSQITLAGNDQVSGANLLARWRREVGRRSDIRVQAYYDRTNRRAPHFKETRDTFDIDFLHHVRAGARQDLLWGFGARLSPGTFTPIIPTVDFRPNEKTDRIYSSFFQDDIQLVPGQLALTVGTKLEHNSYSGFEVQPSARLLWTRRPQETWWAGVTRAVRTPSRLDTDFHLMAFLQATPPVYLQIAGDPNAGSERLIGYELGHRRLLAGSLYLDVAVFHNDYDNLFNFGALAVSSERSPIPHTLITVPYANGVEGMTDGFETALDWRAGSVWQLKGSYSYLHLDLKNKPGNADISGVRNYEGSSPQHRTVLQSRFNLPGNLEFEQTYRYVGALPAKSIRAYSTADVRLGRRFADGLELSIVGQNLLQPQHVEFYRDPLPNIGIKRTVFAKLTWSMTRD